MLADVVVADQHFISPQRKLPAYEAVIATPMENIAVLHAHPEYYDNLKAQYDDRFYQQEVLGQYLNIYAGACYHAFDAQRCAEKPTQFEPHLNGLTYYPRVSACAPPAEPEARPGPACVEWAATRSLGIGPPEKVLIDDSV